MDKSKAAPRRLLQSRRFWSSIISIITLIIAATRPGVGGTPGCAGADDHDDLRDLGGRLYH